jgi:anti-sigma B factor antagonist
MQISIRIKEEDISIVDLGGRITSGEGNVVLRDVVRDLLTGGSNKILLNLHEVGYVDSSGLGELVKAHTSVRNNGGQLKIVNPSKRVNDLLHLTMLHTAFDIQPDEASAIQSFGDSGASKAVA